LIALARPNGDPTCDERRRGELVVGRRVVVLQYASASLAGQEGVIAGVDNPGWDAVECMVLLDGWDHGLSFFWNELMTV